MCVCVCVCVRYKPKKFVTASNNQYFIPECCKSIPGIYIKKQHVAETLNLFTGIAVVLTIERNAHRHVTVENNATSPPTHDKIKILTQEMVKQINAVADDGIDPCAIDLFEKLGRWSYGSHSR